MKGSDWEPGREMGHDRKGQKDTNNWEEEEKRKTETTGSRGSRIHSFLPISTCSPPQGPLTQDSTLLQSSPSIRISFLIKARSLRFKIYGSQQIPQSREL